MLDEINSMGHQLQAKLLRVLQEGYVRRIIGLSDIPVDARILGLQTRILCNYEKGISGRTVL